MRPSANGDRYEVTDERSLMVVGGSKGITIPPVMLAALGLDVGDAVEVSREEGSETIRIQPTRKGDERE